MSPESIGEILGVPELDVNIIEMSEILSLDSTKCCATGTCGGS